MELRSECEFDIAQRVEEFDLELRRDDDGCYWLGHISQPDMQDIGPHDIDEIQDWITAIERGMTNEQAREYMENQRWRRIHPELYDGAE